MVDDLESGAHDYVMKGNLSRLAQAVDRELREAHVRAARRQAETALRESELRYRKLWEASTDAVILIDHSSLIHFANPAVEKISGYKPEEIIGKNLAILPPPAKSSPLSARPAASLPRAPRSWRISPLSF